jgi:hypothetical protein
VLNHEERGIAAPKQRDKQAHAKHLQGAAVSACVHILYTAPAAHAWGAPCKRNSWDCTWSSVVKCHSPKQPAIPVQPQVCRLNTTTWLIHHTRCQQQQQPDQTCCCVARQPAHADAAAAMQLIHTKLTAAADTAAPATVQSNHQMILSQFAGVQQDIYSAGWNTHATLMCCQPPTRVLQSCQKWNRGAGRCACHALTRACAAPWQHCVTKYTAAEHDTTAAAGLRNTHSSARLKNAPSSCGVCSVTCCRHACSHPQHAAAVTAAGSYTYDNTCKHTSKHEVVQSLMCGWAPGAASPTLSQPLGRPRYSHQPSIHMHRCGTHRTTHTNTRRCKTHIQQHTRSLVEAEPQHTRSPACT